MLIIAHVFTNNKQTCEWIPPGLAGKIVKDRPLSEPIRLQDLENSARSQAQKKNKCMYHMIIKCLEENYTLFDEIFCIFKVYITKQSLLTRLQHCGIAAL